MIPYKIPWDNTNFCGMRIVDKVFMSSIESLLDISTSTKTILIHEFVAILDKWKKKKKLSVIWYNFFSENMYSQSKKGESSGVTSKDSIYQNETVAEPCYFSSSIYYGGQENYSPRTRTTESQHSVSTTFIPFFPLFCAMPILWAYWYWATLLSASTLIQCYINSWVIIFVSEGVKKLSLRINNNIVQYLSIKNDNLWNNKNWD